MKKHYRKENDCLNCGTALEGPFCHKCGQENLEMKESFGHMATHAISDYFHFDYQFFHTLKPLLFEPGKLSLDYMAGKRMQYLHPIKMYIFISLVFFILVIKVTNRESNPELKTASTESIKFKAKPGSMHKETAAEKDTAEDRGFHISVKNNDTGRKMTIFGMEVDKNDTYEKYLARQNKLEKSKRDNWFQRYFYKKAYVWQGKKDADEIFLESFMHNVPKMMFILLPVSALLLALAFWRNHKFYVEHLIYTIHVHCNLFLIFTVQIIFRLVLPHGFNPVIDMLDFAVFLYVLWYMFKSLKVFYQRSTFRTITKMIGMSLMYFFSLAVCFMIIIALTIVFSA